jgi:hypothetical protein
MATCPGKMRFGSFHPPFIKFGVNLLDLLAPVGILKRSCPPHSIWSRDYARACLSLSSVTSAVNMSGWRHPESMAGGAVFYFFSFLGRFGTNEMQHNGRGSRSRTFAGG